MCALTRTSSVGHGYRTRTVGSCQPHFRFSRSINFHARAASKPLLPVYNLGLKCSLIVCAPMEGGMLATAWFMVSLSLLIRTTRPLLCNVTATTEKNQQCE